jgi:hypothetical protein
MMEWVTELKKIDLVLWRYTKTDTSAGGSVGPPAENDSGKLMGMISLDDLLLARVRNLNEERRRERPLQLRFPFRT